MQQESGTAAKKKKSAFLQLLSQRRSCERAWASRPNTHRTSLLTFANSLHKQSLTQSDFIIFILIISAFCSFQQHRSKCKCLPDSFWQLQLGFIFKLRRSPLQEQSSCSADGFHPLRRPLGPPGRVKGKQRGLGSATKSLDAHGSATLMSETLIRA